MKICKKMDAECGENFFRKMENKNKANIPIIAMTANAFEEDKKTSLECGMNGHITKPLDPAKMIKIVSSLIK